MTTYAFTSISSSYLPKARVLAESIKSRSPEVQFCLVLAEPCAEGLVSKGSAFDEILLLEDLPIPERRAWTFKHSLVELCTAIKGQVLKHLLGRSDCTEVVYFDPDIVVLSDLSFLEEQLSRGSILLTPHLTEPDQTLEAIQDNEICALRHGIYNLGFLAVANTPQGRRFADWWWDRLRDFCYDDIPAGLFTDQRWVDLAPAFFEDVVIVRDPGWNVATWNLCNRRVEGSAASGFTVNGRPLRFYHFSGLDSGAQLAMLNKYGASMPALYELRDWYVEKCLALDALATAGALWVYDFFENGIRIEGWHRELYRRRPDLQRAFPDPFATIDANASFYHWCLVNHPGSRTSEIEESPALAAQYRRELESIYSSLSWRLASFLKRLVTPARSAIRVAKRALHP